MSIVPCIRPYSLDDAPHLYAAVRESIPEMLPWMPWVSESYSIEDSRKYIEGLPAAAEKGLLHDFVIVDRDTGRYLGGCGINQINRGHNFANLGYWVRTSATGKGVASGAARLVARFAFTELKLARVEIVMHVDNVASRRAAEKSGARFEGILRNRLIVRGVSCDAAMFSLVPGDVA